MSEFTFEHFSITTAQDQENYFSGEKQNSRQSFVGPFPQLSSGLYRIIDGELCKIDYGLSPDEVSRRLDIITGK